MKKIKNKKEIAIATLEKEIRRSKNYLLIRNLVTIKSAIKCDKNFVYLPEKKVDIIAETVGTLISLQIKNEIRTDVSRGMIYF